MILPPVIILCHFFIYYSSVRSFVKVSEELLDGKPFEVQTVVTEEVIKLTATNGAVNELVYSKIKNALMTKNLILVPSKANLIYIFRKDSFTKGTPEEFILYLRSKRIKVK